MGVQYTLFKPSGDPLRAKVDLEFKGFDQAPRRRSSRPTARRPTCRTWCTCARATPCRCSATASTATPPITSMSPASTAWTDSGGWSRACASVSRRSSNPWPSLPTQQRGRGSRLGAQQRHGDRRHRSAVLGPGAARGQCGALGADHRERRRHGQERMARRRRRHLRAGLGDHHQGRLRRPGGDDLRGRRRQAGRPHHRRERQPPDRRLPGQGGQNDRRAARTRTSSTRPTATSSRR